MCLLDALKRFILVRTQRMRIGHGVDRDVWEQDDVLENAAFTPSGREVLAYRSEIDCDVGPVARRYQTEG